MDGHDEDIYTKSWDGNFDSFLGFTMHCRKTEFMLRSRPRRLTADEENQKGKIARLDGEWQDTGLVTSHAAEKKPGMACFCDMPDRVLASWAYRESIMRLFGHVIDLERYSF